MASQSAPAVRVLIVHSVRDTTVADRILAIQRKVAPMGIEVHHASILLAEDVREADAQELKPSEWLAKNESKISQRLFEQMRTVEPTHFILHTGLAFNFAPRVLLEVISILKTRYPEVVFGIQQGSTFRLTMEEQGEYLKRRVREIFDLSPQTQELVALFF